MTMKELQIFENDEFGKIRTVIINGEIWFVGKDVAVALGYISNPRKAVIDHVDDEDKGVTKCDTLGGDQDLTVINESGLYSLILSSKLPGAKKFKRWVTHEVLPALRSSGGYSLEGIEEETVNPMVIPDAKDYLTAARLVAHCPKERLGVVIRLLDKGGFDVSEAKITFDKTTTADTSERIENAMMITGLNMPELAKYVGVPYTTLRHWYLKEAFPKPAKYIELCTAFNTLTPANEAVREPH